MTQQWLMAGSILLGTLLGVQENGQPEIQPDYLTAEERAWLDEHPVIRVAPTPDYPPFEFWNEDGEFQGVVKNYLDHFAQELGIEFEMVRTATWSENLRRLRNKQIDAVSLITPASDRYYVKISKPYISYPALIIVHGYETRNLSLADLSGKMVAVPDDYTAEGFLRQSYPEIKVVDVYGPMQGIELLSKREVDAFFEGRAVVSYLAEKANITNLRIAGDSDFIYANGFGVRDDWEILAHIISKVLDRITPKQTKAFYADWVKPGLFQREPYVKPWHWWLAGVVASVLLLGSLIVFGWNRQQALLIEQLDIARRKTEQANLRLDQSRRDAEAASRAKSFFLANMSHEIRTPMNGVLGMCELLRTTKLAADQRQYLSFATSSAEYLLHLINDILDFSKVEAGKLELAAEAFSVDELLNDVVGLMRVQAKPKDLQLHVQRDAEVDDWYVGDPMRLRQILLNLVSNAIKFTEEGEISVRALRADDGPASDTSDAHLLRFEVHDTGIGVAPEKLDHVFQAFEQADPSTTRRFGGTGLGLAICQKLAELMGGTTDVKSALGKGSVFSFTARLQPASKPTEASPDSMTHQITRSPLRILLAEDGLVNQRVAIELLKKRGHQVDLAVNGKMALDLLAKQSYDVVLMDVQMPEMDGITAVKLLRQREQGGDRERQYVVAMTAHAMKGDRERFLNAGMDGYLIKPFKAAELYACVERGHDDGSETAVNKDSLAQGSKAPVLDEEIALAVTGGDHQLAASLRETCLQEVPAILAQAREAIANNDLQTARRCGHSLKSGLRSIGAKSASAAAEQLEFASDDHHGLSEAVNAVERAFRELVAQIETAKS